MKNYTFKKPQNESKSERRAAGNDDFFVNGWENSQ